MQIGSRHSVLKPSSGFPLALRIKFKLLTLTLAWHDPAPAYRFHFILARLPLIQSGLISIPQMSHALP